MQMRPSRTWQDPNELSKLSDQEIFSGDNHDLLKTAKIIFIKLRELILVIVNMRDWQVQQLAPLYYTLLSTQNSLLTASALAKLRDYYPGFPSEYDITGVAEIENWVWEDYRTIEKIWERFDDPEAQINPEVKKIITKINTILSGDSVDEMVLTKSNSAEASDQKIEPTLTIHQDGHIEYRSADGKIYSTKIKTNSQGFILLELLATNKNKTFTFAEINDAFNDKKPNPRNTNSDDDQGRSHSAAKNVRKKLQVPKTDQLLRSDYGFTLRNVIVVRK